MKRIFLIICVACITHSFYFIKPKNNNSNYKLVFVKEVDVDKGNFKYDEKGDSIYSEGEGIIEENFIGIFPKENDTITIYKLNDDLKEKPEKFSFWSKKDNKASSITFYCSKQDDVKVTFGNQNNIIVNNDTYIINKEYYNFLKQKILVESSILDLTFFLKDGYGDYAQSLEPLNKNWRNQKENNTHKIINAKIQNKNNQTHDQFFNYKFNYKYNKNGVLQSVLGENSFNKNFIKENKKHFIYTVERSINERAIDNEYLYKNKKTLFDSIVGTREKYSNATTYYYTKYQSKLKTLTINTIPKNIEEMLKTLKIDKKEFN